MDHKILQIIEHQPAKGTFWQKRQTKTQISLRLGAASSKSSFPNEETLHHWLSEIRPVKILIRLRECVGWSESSLDAHAFLDAEAKFDFNHLNLKHGVNQSTQWKHRPLSNFLKANIFKLHCRIKITATSDWNVPLDNGAQRRFWSESSLGALWTAKAAKLWMYRLIWDFHYENMPIQIYWKFHHKKTNKKKTWKFSDKNSDIFIFLLKT